MSAIPSRPAWWNLALIIAFGLFASPVAAQVIIWEPVAGLAATDVAIAADGTVWALGTSRTAGGYTIHRRSPGATTWTQLDGGALRIAVEGQTAWTVNDIGTIHRRDGERWNPIGGPRGVDIGANAKSVWLVGDPAMTGGNYSIYRWTGTGWLRSATVQQQGQAPVAAGAVRIDVDSAGNPWVVDAAGRLYAYFNNQWQAFTTTEPAADLSVNTFGEPWIVGRTAALLRFNGQTKQWENAGGPSSAIAERGTQVWHLTAKQEVQRKSAGPQFVAQPSTTLQVQEQTLQITGADGKPLTVKPSSSQATLSTTASPLDATLVTGSGPAYTGPPLIVGGCAANPAACVQHRPTPTTAASKGASEFPPPGLGAFMSGGAALLEKVYSRPDVILSYLSGPFRNAAGNPATGGMQHMCTEPVMNDPAAALMYAMLLEAIAKPQNLRSVEEQIFVADFANFMQRRELFIAERAKWLYDAWFVKESSKPGASSKPSPQVSMPFDMRSAPDPAPLFMELLYDLALRPELLAHADAYLAAITHAPVLQHLAPNIAGVAAWRLRYGPNAPRTLAPRDRYLPFQDVTAANLRGFLLGDGTLSSGASGAHAGVQPQRPVILGPGAAMRRTVASVAVLEVLAHWQTEAAARRVTAATWANWWATFTAALEQSVQSARASVDLDSFRNYEDGPLQIAFYWALAVATGHPTTGAGRWSYPDAIVYQSTGDRSARSSECTTIKAYSGAVPNAFASGRFGAGGAISSIAYDASCISTGGDCVQRYSRPFGAAERLEMSGLRDYSGANNTGVGAAAYRATAVASLLSNDPVKVAEYLGRVQAAAAAVAPKVDAYKAQGGPLTLLNCSGKPLTVRTFNANDAVMAIPAETKALAHALSANLRCATGACRVAIDGSGAKPSTLSGYHVYVKGAIRATNQDAIKSGCGAY